MSTPAGVTWFATAEDWRTDSLLMGAQLTAGWTLERVRARADNRKTAPLIHHYEAFGA